MLIANMPRPGGHGRRHRQRRGACRGGDRQVHGYPDCGHRHHALLLRGPPALAAGACCLHLASTLPKPVIPCFGRLGAVSWGLFSSSNFETHLFLQHTPRTACMNGCGDDIHDPACTAFDVCRLCAYTGECRGGGAAGGGGHPHRHPQRPPPRRCAWNSLLTHHQSSFGSRLQRRRGMGPGHTGLVNSNLNPASREDDGVGLHTTLTDPRLSAFR